MVSALRQLAEKEGISVKKETQEEESLFIQTDKLFPSESPFKFEEPVQEEQFKPVGGSALRKLRQKESLLDEEQISEGTFLEGAQDVLFDVVTQPFGGAVDAAESLANLVLPEDKEIEISDWVPEARTGFGSFVRPASQFFIPYTGAYKIAKTGWLFVKNAGKLKKTLDSARKAKKIPISERKPGTFAFKKRKALTRKESYGIGVGAATLTDAIAFAPHDPNLADLFVQFPLTQNAVTEWLSTDPNGDPGMERLKNTLTGLVPGFIIPEILRGVGKGFNWSTKPMKRKVKKIGDEVKIREDLEIAKKQLKGDDIDVGALKKYQATQRTTSEKVAMFFRGSNRVKKSVIEYLDNVRGIKYLMDVATMRGVKGVIGKDKIGAYGDARFLQAMGGMSEHFLLKKTFSFKNGAYQTKGDGLKVLLDKNLGKNANVDNFFDYMGAKSLLSLKKDKFKGLFPDNTAAKRKELMDIAKQGDVKENYVRTLRAMDDFNSDLLDFAVDTQMITRKQKADFIKNRKHYLPLYRDLSDTELLLNRTGSSKLRVPLTAKVPVGKGEGQLPFSNFFDNYVENVQGIISAGYKNHVKRSTFDIIDSGGKVLKDWAEKLPGHKIKPVKVKAEELQKQIGKQDIEFNLNNLDDVDDLALFRSERIDVGDNEYVFRTVVGKDGVERTVKDVYKINNRLLKLTMDSISPKQYYPTHALVRGMRWAKNLLTRMVTYDPGFFAGANALRDTFSAAILSKNPFHLPVLSTAMNLARRMTNPIPVKMQDGTMISMKELYEEFLLNGGSFGSTLLKSETSEAMLSSLYRKMGHSDYAKNVLNTPKKVFDNYEKLVTGFENASRFTEYTLLRKAGFTARQAALGAREVAVDFGMHGANHTFRTYVSTVPFMNAGLQGMYRTVRALGPGAENRAVVLSKIGLFVGVPTAIMYSMNRSNPDYWNQSQQIRDLNYLIPLGDNNWIKIPKPFEFGAMGTLFESVLSQFDETGKADSFFETLWTVSKQQARLSFMPQIVAPVWNSYMNKTFFGSPVVPDGMKHTIPDYGQSYPWSNRVITAAIESAPPWLRDRLMSPIEFENYIRAYTGAIGGFILDFFDSQSDLFSDIKRPSKRMDELPFMKRFLQLDPSKYTRAEQEFYELKNRASKAINQAKKFKDEFKFELLEDFMKDPENQELMYLNGRLERYSMNIKELNKRRNQIYNLPGISSAKKRAMLDQLEAQSGLIFNLIMDELESMDLEIFEPVFSTPKYDLGNLFNFN